MGEGIVDMDGSEDGYGDTLGDYYLFMQKERRVGVGLDSLCEKSVLFSVEYGVCDCRYWRIDCDYRIEVQTDGKHA